MRGFEDEAFVPVGVEFLRSGYAARVGAAAWVVYVVLRAAVWRRPTGELGDLYQEGVLAARIKVEEICAQTGFSDRHVRNAIDKLREIGWIQTRSNGHVLTFVVGRVLTFEHNGRGANVEAYFADAMTRPEVESYRAQRLAAAQRRESPATMVVPNSSASGAGQVGTTCRTETPSPIPGSFHRKDIEMSPSQSDSGPSPATSSKKERRKNPGAQLTLAPPPAPLDLEAAGCPPLAVAEGFWRSLGGGEVTKWTEHRVRSYKRLCDVLRGFLKPGESMADLLRRYFAALLTSRFLTAKDDPDCWGQLDLNWALGADRKWNKPIAEAELEERVRKALDGEYARHNKAKAPVVDRSPKATGVSYGASPPPSPSIDAAPPAVHRAQGVVFGLPPPERKES